MYHGSQRGWIEVIAGVMFSGKSEELIRFRGEPFAAMPALMAVAETVDKLYAICVVCGDPACRNQRLVDRQPAPYDSPTILVGGIEPYEARCRPCHEVPGVTAGQTRLFQDQHS